MGSRLALVGAGSYAQADNCLSCTISERRHAELGMAAFDWAATGWKREGLAGLDIPLVEAEGLDNHRVWFSPGIGRDLFNG